MPQENPREWTPAEDAMLGSASDQAIAKRLGRTTQSVSGRRRGLGIPRYGRNWAKSEDALLGTKPDYAVAAILGVSYNIVGNRRKELGIPSWKERSREDS